MLENRLYYGDNLPVLRDQIASESVDLVYIDPPFNSSRDYNVIFAERATEERQTQSQIMAFEDTWRWTAQTDYAMDDLARVAPRQLINMLNNFIDVLGRNDMTAYLVMLSGRLVELRRVLKPTGTLFLHCDTSAAHYIKVLLDCLFGKDKMINQFTWKRTSAHSDAKQGAKHAGRISDMIFWYAKGDTWTHNVQYTPYTKDYLEKHYKHVEEGTGRLYRYDNLTGPGGARKGNPQYEVLGVKGFWRYSKENMDKLIAAGRVVQTRPGAVPRYIRYLDEMPGVPLQDIWTDVNPVQRSSKEWLGYPTQKPRKLMERIVAMASNPGDVVLDAFCGCGTTIVAAQSLGREWIGIDITYLAISLIENRLKTMFPGVQYRTIGKPVSVSEAVALAAQNRHQFEWWAISLVGARPAGGDEKKGADTGLDGVLFFREGSTKKQRQIVVQVKSGKVGAKEIRDFAHVIEREKAPIGLFLTLEKPTKPMLTEAFELGLYKDKQFGTEVAYPRLQILTVQGLLEGTEKPNLPFGAIAGIKAAEKLQQKPEQFMQPLFPSALDVSDLDVDEDE